LLISSCFPYWLPSLNSVWALHVINALGLYTYYFMSSCCTMFWFVHYCCDVFRP
jgi:hypothetical protein